MKDNENSLVEEVCKTRRKCSSSVVAVISCEMTPRDSEPDARFLLREANY
jgi:hypothetical protein